MEQHKKVLGILFVVMASIQILVMVLLGLLFTTIFTFAIGQADPSEQATLELVMNILRYVPLVVIIFVATPGLIAGIGLLSKKSWGMVLALIVGIINIFSFPFGTAIGIYTIWIFAEERRIATSTPAQA